MYRRLYRSTRDGERGETGSDLRMLFPPHNERMQVTGEAAMKVLAPVVHPFHGPGHAGGQGAGIDEGSGDAHAITNGHGRKRRIKGGSG